MLTDPASRNTIRFTLGVTVLFAAAQLINWPLAFVAPLFASMFLQSPTPMPWRAGVGLVAVTVALFAAGILFTALAQYPAVQLLTLLIILFFIFRYAAGGGSPLIGIVALIAFLLLPIVGQAGPELVPDIARGVLLALLFGLIVSGLGYLILPPISSNNGAENSAKPDEMAQDLNKKALVMLIAFAPLAIAFYVFAWSSILSLIFAAMLCQQLSAEASGEGGKGLLLANTLGGLVAVLVYFIVIAAPNVLLMLALFLLIMLISGACMFTGHKSGPLVAGALGAFIILLGGSIAPFGTDADEKFLSRILQIGGAVAYVVVAYNLVDLVGSFWKRSIPPSTSTPH